MKPLKEFKEYLENGTAKRISPNNERAKSLISESERKIHSLKERIEKIGVKDTNANDYVEYCYDIIMLLIRAKMYKEGVTTAGQGSHEAEVAYLGMLGFDEKETRFMNELRYYRNGILYYGTILDAEYAFKVIEFIKKIRVKLKKVLAK
ncbi:MAG: hypothetical protein PHW96_02215 [Candidatus Nanoarchaeia archaeon]|nr:hypothetical protein [Candidatus Nanoarchaeia archaeon]